jgi:hypothetical protein
MHIWQGLSLLASDRPIRRRGFAKKTQNLAIFQLPILQVPARAVPALCGEAGGRTIKTTPTKPGCAVVLLNKTPVKEIHGMYRGEENKTRSHTQKKHRNIGGNMNRDGRIGA